MTLGRQALIDGYVDEDRVAASLEARGWSVALFGPRVWDAADPELARAVSDTGGPLAHAPDIIAARAREGVCWVEVVNCAGHVDRCLEVAKVSGADRWAALAPYFVVDVADWRVWQWHPRWARDIVEGPSRYTNSGSGDPYAWFTRSRDRLFVNVFGAPNE